MSTPPTKINLHENQRTWQKLTDNKHRFQLQRYVGYMLEAEDLQFHHDSAVFLPEYLSVDEPGPAGQDHINGVAVLRSALLYAKEKASRKLLIVGHTDRSGSKAYNLKLSCLRAKSVHAALTGDRDAWVDIAETKSRVVDYQVLLQWISRTWGWSCDPVEIDDEHSSQTRQAVNSFQMAYNKFFEKSIKVDGIVGKQSWSAMFDVFMRELAASLESDVKGLEEYRHNLRFVDDSAKAVGVGEYFPKDDIDLDGYRSAKNRRVEILSYEPADIPQQGEYPTTDGCKPKKIHIYNPRLYTYKWIYVDPIPTLVWLDLQTVDELGYRVTNVKLKLDPDQGPTIQITTDEIGYWSDRVLAGNKIRVTMADGRPVRFGATLSDEMPSGGTESTAILVPRVAPRTITDLVVPIVEEKMLEKHRKQVNRYGRHPKSEHNSARSGGSGMKVGETARKTSARVQGAAEEDKRYTRRTFGQAAADNLFIAAGFNGETSIRLLQELLHEWLDDHHPTAIRRGYFLEIVLNSKLLLFDDKQKKLKQFNFKKDHSIKGRLGVYAMQQFYGVAGNIYFIDMNSQTSGFGRNLPEELTKKVDENDPPEAEKPTESVQEEPPKRNKKQEDFKLVDLLESSEQQAYRSIRGPQLAQRKVNLVYLFHDLGSRLLLARHGGTGLLENYPTDKSIHKSIHRRNKLVAQNIGVAYSAYIRFYISKVEEISSNMTKYDKAVGNPHPEIQLHRLGPPDSTFEFPKPIGASRDQYKDILQAYRDGEYQSEFNAWEAITKKLNAIWGKRTEGSIWFTVEFSAEAGNYAGPLSGASVKLNFEADSEGRISTAAGKEVPLTIGTTPKSLGGSSPVTMQFKKNDKTGRVDSKVSFGIGKYGVEAESNGNVKLSYAGVYEEWNQASAIGGMGFEVSLRDMVTKSFKSKPPSWVDDLPNLKFKASIGFRLVTEGTLLKLITNSPGFFEMRPRTDFASLDWATLDWDERRALEVLGFDRTSWDDHQRTPATKKQFNRLSPQEKVSAVLVPIPTSDPEWLEFWYAWEQRKV